MGADFVDDAPVVVTSDFLDGVHRHLTRLTQSFSNQESSARRLLLATRNSVGTAEQSWTGPRATKVIGGARTYLDAVDEYPKALSDAAATLARWAGAALGASEMLAELERQAVPAWLPGDRWSMPTCGVANLGCSAPDPAVLAKIEAVRDSWARTCVAFATELDGAVRAITTANGATAVAVDHEQAEQLRSELAIANLGGAADVKAWWGRLTDGERLALIATYPALISRIDGVPARARALAERTQSINGFTRLEAAEAEGTLTPAQRRRLDQLRTTLGQPGDGGRRPTADSQEDVDLVAVHLPTVTARAAADN